MEDIKKENQELKNNFYMETSHLLDAHLRGAIWSWIEQKIDEACKKQREICARLHLEGLGYTPDSVTPSSNMILNAPSPKESE